MAVTLATTPTYALPGDAVKITPTVGTGNYLRLFCTAAPKGSKYRAQLDDDVTAQRVQVHEGDAVDFTLRLDVGGKYTFAAQDISKGATTFGGGYEGDPDSYATETINSEDTKELYVGEAVEFEVGRPPDIARLRVWVWNATIRETTKQLHGEVTPGFAEGSIGSILAETAAESSAVDSALTALIGVAAATALGDLNAVLDDIREEYDDHRTQATVHYANDTDNTLIDFSEAESPEGIIVLTRYLLGKLNKHERTDGGEGDASGNYHEDGSSNTRADYKNAPLFSAVSNDLDKALNVIADMHRSYEAHRVDTDVHQNADATNALAALPLLLQVHSAFLGVLASESPTAPTTRQAGVVALVHGGGGRRPI